MSTALAIADQSSFFSPEQEKIILSTFLGGASKQEAQVLLATVQRRRLDPFSRQVYFVKRWDIQKREEVWAIQTSIDGLRSIAERTGKYDGQDEPEYGKDEAGEFCKVRVYRKDWTSGRAAVGVAYLSEFIQKKKDGTVTAFWARMPRLMLAKCAEALAIRKAFPEDTAGLYVPEEMPEASEQKTEARAIRVEPAPETLEPTPENRANAHALVEAAAQELGGTVEPSTIDARVLYARIAKQYVVPAMRSDWIAKHAGRKPEKFSDLTRDELRALSKALDAEQEIP